MESPSEKLDIEHPAHDLQHVESTRSGPNLAQLPSTTSTHAHLSFREVAPVNVSVSGLSVQVTTGPSIWEKLTKKHASQDPKTIINNVSSEMPSGSLTAILGGSGSGKTTMLNVLANKLHGKRLSISGSVSFDRNGESRGLSGIRYAYMKQQDILIPTLSVRETLRFSADLRLPASISEDERKAVVEEVILELGLKEAADTRIGNNVHKGCSGGEKRRVSLGVQLLANPSVLFLDEPTTGLDATSAFQLVRTLKTLAKKGRTIIVTVHSPRSEIWSLFDRLILLTKGSPAYSGSVDDCLPYFSGLGHELPPFVNPAEHLIDIVAVDNRSPELEEASTQRVQSIVAAWRQRVDEKPLTKTQPKVDRDRPRSAPGGMHDGNTSFLRQTRVLTERTWIVTIRDPLGMLGSLVEAVAMAVINGLVFFQLGEDIAGIRSRQGALYIASALQGYLIMLFDIYRLTIDIQLFDRERSEGVVGVPAFLVSRRLARFFIEDIPVPLLFSIIYYFMCGLRPDGAEFLIFFSVILLEHYVAVSFSMLAISLSRNFAGASLIANLSYTAQSFSCGYFIQANTIPVYVRWLKWTAYVFYAFGALAYNEFWERSYDCPVPDPSSPVCKQFSGNFIYQNLGFPGNWIWRPIVALVGFVFAYYIGAGFILQFLKTEMELSKARNSELDESAGKEKMTARSNEEIRTVNIRLDKFSLDIEKRKWWGGKAFEKSILHPVTSEFPSHSLNAIMGPSGSGKTSLLNSLARRLKDDATTKYKQFGRMLYNGAMPSADVVRSVSSFVTQDDEGLLSSLTVRETLRFAANLRLPSFMTTKEKNQRAESVLLKLGLKDCANNLIGGELVKGISGGERRRVSIAIQVLTEPRVLLLDEPTSGLDAFTASSIIHVLRGLAEEGRTLVLTVHQSRSDLFSQFDTVLLLSRGGHSVYAGPGDKMLDHFANEGYHCPKMTNPADFALDLITVDLQREDREVESRAKVRKLIESWGADKFPQTPSREISTPAELGSLKRSMTSFRIAYPILMRRAIINCWRQPPVVMGRIFQVVGLGIVAALFFAPLHDDYYSVQNRLGLVQEVAPLYFVGMLQNVAVYPDEKDVFYREHDDRVYGVEAFILQYTAIEVPFEIVSSLIFAVLADLAVGLPRTAKIFFIMAYNCFCIVSCGESLGIMFNTLFDHTGFAVNVTSVFLSVAQVMSGVMSLNIPAFLQAFNYLNPIKYSTGNLAVYTFRDQQFTCEDFQRLPNGRCPIENGQQVLTLYNLNKDEEMYILGLGLCVIIYRFLAYLLLKAKKDRWLARVWRMMWRREE